MLRFKLRTLLIVTLAAAILVTAWALIEPAIRNFEPDSVWIKDGRAVLIDYGTVGPNYNPATGGMAYIRERTIAIPVWTVVLVTIAIMVAIVFAVRMLKQIIFSATH